MSKAFTPVSVLAGLMAGQLAKKLFNFVWGRIIDQEPPEPEHREPSYPMLTVALALEGLIARLVRGYVDHGLRIAWSRNTGEWPGDPDPEPK